MEWKTIDSAPKDGEALRNDPRVIRVALGRLVHAFGNSTLLPKDNADAA